MGTFNPGKAALGAALLFVLLFTLPFIAQAIGLIGGVSLYAWLLIVAAFIIANLKIALAHKISGQFRFDRHGNDLCILALTGCLTLVAMQAANKTDVVPGARHVLAKLGFAALHSDPVWQNVFAGVVFGLLALIIFIGTAFGLDYIRKQRGSPTVSVIAFGCYFAGMLCAAFYALSMAVRG